VKAADEIAVDLSTDILTRLNNQYKEKEPIRAEMQPLYCRIQLLFYLAAFHPILVLQRFSVVVVAEDSSSSSVVWDKYAISPRKCIYFNNQDVIIYSMFDNGNTVCNGQAAGLYYTDVSTFVSSYLEQQQQDAQISGSSYQEPSVASYLTCTLHEQNGQNVYSQLGCSKSSVHNLTVNLYSDSTCTTRVPYSSDTISVDLSDFSVRIRITNVLIFLSPLLDDCHQCTKNALLPCNSYFPFLYILYPYELDPF